MADILIRGMELPTVCGRCPIEQFNEWFIGLEMYCCLLIKDGYTTDIREVERRDDCPLVELPEHGDLIDRDAFREENEYYLNREFINPKYEDTLDDLLKDAPVVIPSNKEATE